MINIKEEQEKEINNELICKKKNDNMLMAAFMMFIFPIITIFLGVFIGGYIGKVIETSIIIFQVIGGIVGFLVAMVIIKLFDKSVKTNENVDKITWDDL